jgi:AraC-like DNA-binding protein
VKEYLTPEINGLNIQILAGHYRCYHNWGGEFLKNDYARLYWIEEGRGLVKTMGKDVILEPGYLYLFQDSTLANYAAQSFKLLWIHFRIELYDGMSIFNFVNAENKIKIVGDDVEKLKLMINNFEVNTTEKILANYALLINVVSKFFIGEKMSFPTQNDVMLFKNIIDELKEHPPKPFNLAVLAHKVFMHPVYFSNKFKQCFGVSPLKFHIQQRMDYAYYLLTSTNKSLKEISEECGCIDQFYFSRMIKKHFSMCPTEIRIHYRVNQNAQI